MKVIWLKHDRQEAALKLKGELPDSSNVRQTLDEDSKLISPDGKIAALFLRNVIPARLHKRAYNILKHVDELPENRVNAVGTIPLPRRRKKDGTWSPSLGVNEKVLQILKKQGVRSGTLGYLPCHETQLTKRHPEMLRRNEALIKLTDGLYAEHLRTFYEKQVAVVEKVPRCRLWNTAFTTVYITKDWQTSYHRDGNLKGVMTAITSLGEFTGGALVVVRWGVAIPYQPGDVLFFDAEQLHGTLPFEGKRLSAIFYCARRIADCGKSSEDKGVNATCRGLHSQNHSLTSAKPALRCPYPRTLTSGTPILAGIALFQSV